MDRLTMDQTRAGLSLNDALTGEILPPGRGSGRRLQPLQTPQLYLWLERPKSRPALRVRRTSPAVWFLTGLLVAPLACLIVIMLGFV
jgi:hypothetical protein